LKFEVAIGRGHKTGFFLDQRDNRARIGALSRGRHVLDLCCYTGGFALNAWKGGATQVRAVDLDEKAIAQAQRNAALNAAPADRVQFTHGDAFDVLRAAAKSAAAAPNDATRPGLIVLDPPKLAEDRHELESAARKYRDLMRLALSALAPDGILLTCSCSGPVSEEMFIQYLQAAALDANVHAAIFQIAGAAPDHPIALHALENRYLKAVFCRKLPG
jgi:23S rRNA (cytosine1962-C5)-methyltransferase